MEPLTRPLLGFGQEHFGAAVLGDRRRTHRLVYTANRMLEHPDGTLPHKLDDPKDLKGLYRLANTDAVTHAAVLGPHRDRTLRRMRAYPGTVLLLPDTTELDYSGLHAIDTLGQIGEGHGRGYQCPNSLAVAAESGAIFGLAHQILFHRPHAPKKETKAQRRQRANRESRLGKQGSVAIPPAPAAHRWIDVWDRAADLTEFLEYEHQHHKSYVVRSQHNRRMRVQCGRRTRLVYLHSWARSLPEQGRYPVEVQAQKNQPARTATVTFAWAAARILPPRQPRGEHSQEPLPVWIVMVREVSPPPGVAPLEWILLTNVPVRSAAEALERVAWYKRRPLVEEHHKGLKTGCAIEALQFTTEAALQPVIALIWVVTLVLLELRTASRAADAHDRPATTIVPWEYVEVLHRWRWQGQKPRRDWSVYDFCYALARLGGHQNRKGDGPPGWLVLQRGWTKLQAMGEGAHPDIREKCGQT